MSFTRLFRFTCDNCKETAEVYAFGGPDGWMWHYNQGKIEHVCPTCAQWYLDVGAKRDPHDPKHLLTLVTAP